MVGDIPTLDGHAVGINNHHTIWHAYDKLINYADRLNPLPMLAESWDLSTDGKQIKLNLRKGVQFHSGREFTADDVIYNLERVKDPKNTNVTPLLSVGSSWWTGIQTPDKYTLVLSSDQPRPGVFDFLLYFNILDKETMQGPDATTKVVGTGAFTFVEWVSGDHITLAKNRNYWDPSRPYLDEIRISIFADPRTEMVSLQSRAIDAVDLAPIRDALTLKSSPDYQVVPNPNLGQYFYVAANTTRPPFDNKQLRQAIAYAVDRKRFTDTVMQGTVGPPQDLPWAPQSAASEPAKNTIYTFDLDKAKSLIAAAGAADALEFDITFNQSSFAEEYASLAQILQADLAQIGVKTTLKRLDNPTFTSVTRQLGYNGLILSAGAFAHLSEASLAFSAGGFNYTANSSGFTDPKLAQLVTSAAVEPDLSRRKAIYSQLNDFLLDQCFMMPISLFPSVLAARSGVHGMKYENSNDFTYNDTWID